jgi:DNA-damage-inducible protein J
MSADTSMLHVRVDAHTKAQAAETLENFGLTLSDAVRILLKRIVQEGGLPPGLTASQDAYDAWFRDKVQEALADSRPPLAHGQMMNEVQSVIDGKRHARH